jgi:molecular chaperone GrpE
MNEEDRKVPEEENSAAGDAHRPVPASGEENPGATETDEDALLREELEEALREKSQFRALAQRAQADLENYKRRAADEREEARRASTSGLLLKLLSVIDDLDRAMSLVPEDAVAPGWLDGLQLVQRNVGNLLELEAVTRIEAMGAPFDPWISEAVVYMESSEADEGSVIEVIREGYKHHDKLLRAAQVVVAKKPVAQGQDEENEKDEQEEGQ